MFHLVSLSLQISLNVLPGPCLGLCVGVACFVGFVGLVVGFFLWGNLISITGSFQLLTDHVSHLSGNAGKKKASRPSPRTKPLLVDLGVLHQRALQWKGDPNPWLFSRSRLLMYENKAYSWSITCTTLISLLVPSLLLPSQLQNANVAYPWIKQQAMALPFVLQLNWPATPTDHLSAV